MVKAFAIEAVIGFLAGLGVGAMMQAAIPEVYRAAEVHHASAREAAQYELIARYEMEVRSAYHARSGEEVCPVVAP